MTKPAKQKSKKPRSTSSKAKKRSTRKRATARKLPDKFIGRLKGLIEVVGDIEVPLDPPVVWESAMDADAGEGARATPASPKALSRNIPTPDA